MWNPDEPQTIDFFANWEEVPDNTVPQNGFKAQWEMFLKHVAEDAPWPYGLEAGRQGRASSHARPAELEGTPLARRPGAGDLRWRFNSLTPTARSRPTA